MKKNILVFLLLSAAVGLLGLYIWTNFIKNTSGDTKSVETRMSAPAIVSSSASSTDKDLRAMVLNTRPSIQGADKSSILFGDIVLSKSMTNYTDVLTFASAVVNNKKTIYVLQYRKVDGALVFVSSSALPKADRIIGLRASDSTEPDTYYLDVEFAPTGSLETSGAIKKVYKNRIE